MADNTPSNTHSIVSALEHDTRLSVSEAEPDSQSVTSAVAKKKPDVVLLSAEVGDDPYRGFQVALKVRSLHIGTRIVMLLDTPLRQSVVEAFRSGARGVFSRGAPMRTLPKCIHCVSQGEIWANNTELGYLVEAFSPLGIEARNALALSSREREVSFFVAEGLSNREIGERLGLTEHTVKNYLSRISTKLGASNRVKVALYACGLASRPA